MNPNILAQLQAIGDEEFASRLFGEYSASGVMSMSADDIAAHYAYWQTNEKIQGTDDYDAWLAVQAIRGEIFSDGFAADAAQESEFHSGEDGNAGFSFGGAGSDPNVPRMEDLMNRRGADRMWRNVLDYSGGTDNSDPAALKGFVDDRYQSIQSSLAQAPIRGFPGTDVFISDAQVGAGNAVQETPSRFRDPQSGRFVKKTDNAIGRGNIDAALEKVKEKLQEFFNANYARLPIGQGGGAQTGTLQRAVAQLVPKIERTPGQGFVITLQLPDMTRPGRNLYDAGMNVRDYGPMVFHGRRAVIPATAPALRFQIGRPLEYITAKTVKPSRTDLDIWQLTDGQKAELKALLGQTFKGAALDI